MSGIPQVYRDKYASTCQQPGAKKLRCPASAGKRELTGCQLRVIRRFSSRTCIAGKGFTETNRRRYTAQQPATKSARGSAVKPVINRWSTAG